MRPKRSVSILYGNLANCGSAPSSCQRARCCWWLGRSSIFVCMVVPDDGVYKLAVGNNKLINWHCRNGFGRNGGCFRGSLVIKSSFDEERKRADDRHIAGK